MPLCGFNQEMIDGLSGFHKGLVEHGIIDRSKKKGLSTGEIMNKEFEDMGSFLEETHRINEPEVRELTEALVRYACAFYKIVQKRKVDNYKEIIQFLNKFYFSMDDKYYSELEGKPQAMKKLAEYLNQISA